MNLGKYFLLISVLFLLFQCKPSNIIEGQLIGISPDKSLIHGYSFTLTVKGREFSTDSIIYFNEKQIETTFIDASTLSCTIESVHTLVQSETQSEMDGGNSLVDVYVYSESEDMYSNTMEFVLQSNPTFNNAIEIKTEAAVHYSDSPKIKADNFGNVFLVYPGSYTTDGIYYSSSNDNGRSWNDCEQVLPLSVNSGSRSCRPSMTLDTAGTIHISYYNWNKRNAFYIYKKSNQQNWSIPESFLNIFPGFTGYGKLAVDRNDKVFYVWNPYSDLYMTSLDNSSSNWAEPEEISLGERTKTEWFFHIDKNSILYIVWVSMDRYDSKYYLNLAISKDSGKTWELKQDLASFIYMYSPSIATSDENIVISYVTSTFLERYINVISSADGGKIWNGPIEMDNDDSLNQPKLISDKAGNFHMAWTRRDEGNEKNLIYCRSTDGAINWSEGLNVLKNGEDVYFLGNLEIDKNGYPFFSWMSLPPGSNPSYKLLFVHCLY